MLQLLVEENGGAVRRYDVSTNLQSCPDLKWEFLWMTFNDKTLIRHSFDMHIITFFAAIISKIINIRCNSAIAILTTISK